jgi:hypothetical protein
VLGGLRGVYHERGNMHGGMLAFIMGEEGVEAIELLHCESIHYCVQARLVIARCAGVDSQNTDRK